MSRLKYDTEKQSITNTINALINGYERNCNGKRELKNVKNDLVNELQSDENEYIVRAKKKELHLLSDKTTLVNPRIDIDLLESYRKRIDKDKFLPELVSPAQMCCYCGTKSIITQEHVLKKESYYQYAISPCNIVPACSACNTDKGTWSIDGDQKRTPFHPYFESYDFRPYLVCKALLINASNQSKINKAKVDKFFQMEIEFNESLRKNQQYPEYERYKNNFEMFKLKKIYSYYANSVLLEFVVEMKRVTESQRIILDHNKTYILNVLGDWINQKKQSNERYSFMNPYYSEKLALEKLEELLVSKDSTLHTKNLIKCIMDSPSAL